MTHQPTREYGETSIDGRPEHGTVESDGLRLHYVDWGNKAAPSMVLLHGTASHARIWDRFAASLSDSFHIVAFDQRGFGDSDWPPDYRVGYFPDRWTSDINAVVNQLAMSPMVLIGLSAGGASAIHYTADNPEKVGRLVIVEMGPVAGRAGVTGVIKSIPSREEFDNEEEAVQYLVRSNGRADPAMARAHAIHSLKSLEDGRVVLKGDPSLRRKDWRRPLRSVEENWSAVRRITRPTLLVRGGDSKLLTVETAERMQREMVDCTLVTIPGAGHTVPMHSPAEFEAAVCDWLVVSTPSS